MAKKISDIGKLRNRITIQKPIRVTDSVGGFSETWENVTNIWASINVVSFNTKLRAEQLEHNVSHKIIIRFISDLKSEYRIQFETRIFQIKGFSFVDEGKRFIEIIANEGDPA